MKIYSKGTFALALLWLGLGLEKLIRCLWGRGPDGSDLLWLVICGINVVVNLYTALDEERSEVRKRSVEKSRRIARAMFGKWWRAVLWFGAVPVLVSVIWAMARPGGVAPLGLILAGAAYTIAICLIVDHRAKREQI